MVANYIAAKLSRCAANPPPSNHLSRLEFMKSDAELKKDILAELEFDPSVRVEDIEVTVQEGIATLKGFAHSYAEKLAAIGAVKRIAGIRGLAEDILVKLPDSYRRTDSEIAAAATNTIKWIVALPEDAIRVTVRDGWLSLEGTVDAWHLKQAAEEAVRNLTGIKGITNLMVIKPSTPSVDATGAIQAALERHALLDARQIQVETNGNNVLIRGNVRSFIERDEAERAASAAPGVTQIENRIVLII